MKNLPLPANDNWPDGVWDVEPFEKNGIRLVFFAPHIHDYQTMHEEDEFYFIARGSGELVIGSERHTFQAGHAFFVPAKVEHRFEEFSEDFAAWAIFF